MSGSGTWWAAGPSLKPYIYIYIYMAASLQPCKKYVTHIKTRGIPSILVLREDTPLNVRTWIKTEHNELHSGNASTLVEDFDIQTDAQADWTARRLSETLTKDSMPKAGAASYDWVIRSHIRINFKKPFANWDYLQNIQSWKDKVNIWKCSGKVRQYIENSGDILNIHSKNSVIAAHGARLAFVVSTFRGAWSDHMLAAIVLTSMKFLMPTLTRNELLVQSEFTFGNEDDEGMDFLLNGPADGPTGCLEEWLRAPMSGVVQFKVGKAKVVKAKPNAKRKAKGNAKKEGEG